jgi:hypothetical protein
MLAIRSRTCMKVSSPQFATSHPKPGSTILKSPIITAFHVTFKCMMDRLLIIHTHGLLRDFERSVTSNSPSYFFCTFLKRKPIWSIEVYLVNSVCSLLRLSRKEHWQILEHLREPNIFVLQPLGKLLPGPYSSNK